MFNILVADDDADIRELVEMKLRSMGHVVTVANDGAAALTAVDEHDFDLALLDIGMPGTNGLDVTCQIRGACPVRRMPIILMSAYATAADIRRGYDAGADDYVTKPFSPRDLGERVRVLLAQCPAVRGRSLGLG